MELKEIVAPTMKTLFIAEIERKILAGEWQIGDRLPSEREMEQRMKVSRTIINSGLTELARKGFVEIIPRQGVFVGDYIRNGHLDVLASIMNFNGGRFNRKTFDSLMEYRLNTECECAYLAALHRTDDDLQQLKELHNKIMQSNDYNLVAILKVEFQHSIYCATGNTIYPLIFNSFKNMILNFNQIIYRHTGTATATYRIQELIDAIEKHEAAKAKSIMHDLVVSRVDELSHWYFKE
jgi:GntR family transcriptional regulator, transcriptional repressor for pyruvate dehydrogenase complex